MENPKYNKRTWLNKDIQTLIEEASKENHKGSFNSDSIWLQDQSFQAGASFALSLFKWRKVSEELPEVKNEAYPVLVYRKYKKEEYKMDTLWIIPDMSVGDSFKFYGVTEWMPIPQID